MFPAPIRALIREFSQLPGVGKRTAERFVFSLLQRGKKDVAELSRALVELMNTIRSCEVCFTFADTTPCARCTAPERSKQLLCVVATPTDLEVIDRLSAFHGQYHVLRGTIQGTDDTNLDQLKIPELFVRLLREPITEILLALNPDFSGESTMLFLEREIAKQYPHIELSRLARGIPMGGDLAYADDVTLRSALEHRTKK